MKKCLIVTFVMVFATLFALPVSAQYGNTRTTTMDRGQTQSTYSSPVAFSLFDPVQWPGRANSVTGVRFNVFYAEHRNLTGIDLGLFLPINRVSRDMTGVQWGIYNGVDRHGGGIQFGAINYVGQDFTGLQYGIGNISYGKVKGVQLGLYNQASAVSGLQFGALNVTDSLYGVQLGLGNLKNEPNESFPASGLPFFPVFNWSF